MASEPVISAGITMTMINWDRPADEISGNGTVRVSPAFPHDPRVIVDIAKLIRSYSIGFVFSDVSSIKVEQGAVEIGLDSFYNFNGDGQIQSKLTVALTPRQLSVEAAVQKIKEWLWADPESLENGHRKAVALLLNVRSRYQVGAIDATAARRSATYTVTSMTPFPDAVDDAKQFVVGETNVMFGRDWSEEDLL